jgi:hypothetical protein
MSDHQQENALRIAAYLENRLSPAEREAFKLALSEDDELRLQYVDALMNKVGTGSNAGGTAETMTGAGDTGETVETLTGAGDTGGMAEPAEGAVGMGGLEEPVREAGVGEREEAEFGPREAWEAGWPGGKKGANGGFLGSRWMVGAAVLLLIIAGVVMFMMTSHQGFWDKTVADSGNANEGNGMDSAAGMTGNRQVAAPRNGVDSAAAGSGARSRAAGAGVGAGAAVTGGKEGLADSLYAKLYKPYMRGDDPIEVREYYQDYRTGNYAAVVAAGDSVVMKIPVQRLLARDYMRLYMGLSYLATGDGRNAVRELEGVVLRTKPGDILYENASWYLALAWLKRNDVGAAEAKGKALGLAREIAHSYSRYREAAGELMKALGS